MLALFRCQLLTALRGHSTPDRVGRAMVSGCPVVGFQQAPFAQIILGKNPSSPPQPLPLPPAVIPFLHEVDVIGAVLETSGTMRPVRPEPAPPALTITCPPVAVAAPPAASALPPVLFPPVAAEFALERDFAEARDCALDSDRADCMTLVVCVVFRSSLPGFPCCSVAQAALAMKSDAKIVVSVFISFLS